MKKLFVLAVFTTILFALPLAAGAAGMGVYCWQQDPFLDVICFDIDNKGSVYELTGTDHVSGDYKTALDGAAVLDPYLNQIMMEFTQTFADFSYQVEAIVDPVTLNGTWTDDAGSSGNFLYLGTGPQTKVKVQSSITRQDSR